jgi:hypothetical protein
MASADPVKVTKVEFEKINLIGDQAIDEALNLILQIVAVRVDTIEEIRDEGKSIPERKLKQHL